ncbi:MAG: phosphate--AMP phosphotransferase [Lentisphaerota bacterium]
MLSKVDLSKKLSKPVYRKRLDEYTVRLGELQRDARELGIPVLIVFEGWDAAGKGTLINKLILAMDPRGFTVQPTNAPTEEERLRPFLWRFWSKTPARGRVAVFDRSWYGRVLVERIDKVIKKKQWDEAYESIGSFEQQLIDDGAVIVKFLLHISKAEQKKRFKKLLKNPATQWKVTKDDWKHHKQYGLYAKAFDDMLEKTSFRHAPWAVVEAHDERYATAKVFHETIKALEQRVNATRSKKAAPPSSTPNLYKKLKRHGRVLDHSDLSQSLSKEEYQQEVAALQKRLWDLEHEIYIRRVPVIITYEGWDAAGKGGNIKRLVRNLDPRGYEVVPIAAPNVVEKNHHYLWRFWTNLPKAGHITIFDRTWYGRVLVERIEGFCKPGDWQRAYAEINDMEKQITNFGTVLVKLWLQIDKEEQLRRFTERQKSPLKQWKITDEDWRNREKWDAYYEAVDDMLALTSTPHAPWTIIEANSKYYARIKTLRSVVEAIEKKLR